MKANLRSSLIASSILSIMMMTGTSNAFAVESAPTTAKVEQRTPAKTKKKKAGKAVRHHAKTATKVSGKVDISKVSEPATNSGKAATGVAAALQPVGEGAQKPQAAVPAAAPATDAKPAEKIQPKKAEDKPVVKNEKPAPSVAAAPAAPKGDEKKVEQKPAVVAAPKVDEKKTEAAAPKVEAPKAEAPKAEAQKPVTVAAPTVQAAPKAAPAAAKPVIDTKTLAKNLLKPNVSEEAKNAAALAEIKRMKEQAKSKSAKPTVHVAEVPAKKKASQKPVRKDEVKIAKQKRPTLPSLAGVKTLKGPRTHKKMARHSKPVRVERKVVKSEQRKVKVIPAVKIARRNETRVERRREARREKLAPMRIVSAPQMDKAAFEYMECSKHSAGAVACMEAKIEKAQREVVDHEEARLMNCGELRKEKRGGDPRVEGMVSTTLVRLQNEEAAGLTSALRQSGEMSNAEKRELKLRSLLRYGTIVGTFADELCSDSAFERIFAKAFETNGFVSPQAIVKYSPKQSYNPEQVYIRASRRGVN